MRFAIRDRLFLADSLGGALAVGVLFGLRSLGLGFGLRSGFALGVSVGRRFTGDVSVQVVIAIASRNIRVVVVHSYTVHKAEVAIGNFHGSTLVGVDSMNSGVHIVRGSAEDHVDVLRCREFLAGHRR